VGDRLGRDLGCGSAVGRAGCSDPRAARPTQRPSFPFDGFAKEDRQWDIPALRLGFEGLEGGLGGTDRGATEPWHDA